MKFAILRTEKLKSHAELLKTFKHAFRELPTPNAVPELLGKNTNIGANSSAEAMAAFEARLPATRRANSVLAIEYLIAASPEAMNSMNGHQQDAYFDTALGWLRTRHGAENVIYAGIHRDESTNHMYAYVVPRDPDTGRLNAKRWLGGTKVLRQMQTDFADQVGKPHGLERGIEGSKAHHMSVQQFYGALQAAEKAIQIPAEEYEPKVLKSRPILGNIVEDGAETKERIEKLWSPVAKRAATAVLDRRRADEMTRTAQAGQEEVKRLLRRLKSSEQALEQTTARFTGGLESDQIEIIQGMADTFRQANLAKAEQARRVAALPLLLVNRAGAVHTFAQRGIEAIKRAGEWQRVNWKAVEKAAIAEAVNEHGQPERKSTAEVWKVSPGRVDMTLEAIEHRTADLPDTSLDVGSDYDQGHEPGR